MRYIAQFLLFAVLLIRSNFIFFKPITFKREKKTNVKKSVASILYDNHEFKQNEIWKKEKFTENMCELLRLLFFDCEIFGMRPRSLKTSDLHINFLKSFLYQGDFDPANSTIMQFMLVLRKSCPLITR